MGEGQQQFIDYYYSSYLTGLANARVDLYAWQNHANEVMLWVVCGLAVSGVALAAAQLFWSFKLQQVPASSTLETSPAGIKIASPFVGIIILFLSFSFFLLFVREVYTIKQPASVQQSAASTPAGPAVPAKAPQPDATVQQVKINRSNEFGY